MIPSRWGPPFWMSLHTITFNYPFTPTEEDKLRTLIFFKSLEYVLPCPSCRVHYKQNLEKYPLTDALDNRRSLVEWLINIHNSVNTMNGKKTLTVEEVHTLYEKLLGQKLYLEYDEKNESNEESNEESNGTKEEFKNSTDECRIDNCEIQPRHDVFTTVVKSLLFIILIVLIYRNRRPVMRFFTT